MPKYEIMFLLDAECNEEESSNEVKQLVELFETEEDFKMSVSWSSALAYDIKGKSSAHRYILNFSTDKIEKLEKFKTLSSFNPKVLRYLIINIEKNYGYKKSINPKRIAIAERKAQKYKEYQEMRARRNKFNERGLSRTPVNN